MQQVFHVDEPTRSIQSGPRPFRRRQLCDSPLVSVHVLGRLLSAGLVSKVPWGGGAALTSFFSRQSTRSCHAGQDGASPSARVHACALFSGTGPIRRRADHCPGISLARHAGWRACVRAGDLSRVGLAGSPNPHRSSPGGSEDGVSGGCAHHRESTVHPRCPLHPAVLPLFFFGRRRTACVPKTCPNARLIGFGLFIYFGLRCPASALSAAGLPRVSFSLALPPTNPPGSVFIDPLDAAVWGG